MFAGRHLMDRYVWELRELVQSGQVTPTQVVQACLERVAERDGAGELRCFLHLDAAGALAEAAEQTARQAAGEALPPLAGIPIGVKDLDEVKGMPTTYGHLLFGDPPPPSEQDSVGVGRLRAAGAIVVGKTNTPAEGHKGDTSNLLGPPCRNPWCLSLSPGGSSGGSVSAVAARILPMAHGTDGGGSIRGPCSLTGTFGVKPTRGLIPGPWRYVTPPLLLALGCTSLSRVPALCGSSHSLTLGCTRSKSQEWQLNMMMPLWAGRATMGTWRVGCGMWWTGRSRAACGTPPSTSTREHSHPPPLPPSSFPSSSSPPLNAELQLRGVSWAHHICLSRSCGWRGEPTLRVVSAGAGLSGTTVATRTPTLLRPPRPTGTRRPLWSHSAGARASGRGCGSVTINIIIPRPSC